MQDKIKRQLEYYFDDYNLLRDQFLKNEIKLSKDGGNNGFVQLDIMLKFNRLSELSSDKDAIVTAIESSELVQLNEDKTGVRRNPERKLPIDDEIYRAGLKARTVFVDGFPQEGRTPKNQENGDAKPFYGDAKENGDAKAENGDAKAENTDAKVENGEDKTEDKPSEPAEEKSEDKPEEKPEVELEPKIELSELFVFFETLGYHPEHIAMRTIRPSPKVDKSIVGRFTGSLFVTFKTQAEVEKFLEEDVKFRDKFALTKMTKNVYWSVQNAKTEAKKRGGNVEAAVVAAKKKAASMAPAKFEEGAVVLFSGVTDATIRREDFKDFMVENDAAVNYISFETGKPGGSILLSLEAGKNGKEVIPETVVKNIKGNDVTFSLGTEDDFNQAQTEYMSFKKRMDANKSFGKRTKGRKYKGSNDRRGNKFQKFENKKTVFNSDDEGEPTPKVAKVDE